MTRQEKYRDTKTFRYFNANPKGRQTTDCVIRAIATAVIWEDAYNTVIRLMADFQIKTGFDPRDGSIGMGKFLEEIGFIKHKQPRKDDRTKYTGKEFCEQIAEEDERIVANLGGNHTVAIIGCRVHDTWNSTGGCIGNYWTLWR